MLTSMTGAEIVTSCFASTAGALGLGVAAGACTLKSFCTLSDPLTEMLAPLPSLAAKHKQYARFVSDEGLHVRSMDTC